MPDGERVRPLLAAGVSERAFPAATIEVGTARDVTWRHATGRLTYDASATPASSDTVFDLASLTKVIATTSLAMGLAGSRGAPSL